MLQAVGNGKQGKLVGKWVECHAQLFVVGCTSGWQSILVSSSVVDWSVAVVKGGCLYDG